MADRVVLRASPDWLTLDLADTRPFLLRTGFPEDRLERFVAMWDGAMALGWREMRHRLRTLALDTVRATGVVAEAMPAEPAPEDRIVFLDDDDWLAPGLFEALHDRPRLGWRWGSVRIGLDYDPTAPGAGIVACRPLAATVYTNNYAVTGEGLARHGSEALFEHEAAHRTFAAAPGEIADLPAYLSCAVKHPCSTTAAARLLADPGFLSDPFGVVAGFADALRNAAIPPAAAWTAGPVRALADLLAEAAV